jgi:hypothetical protein
MNRHLWLSVKQLYNAVKACCVQRPQEALVVLHDKHMGGAAHVQRVPARCSE